MSIQSELEALCWARGFSSVSVSVNCTGTGTIYGHTRPDAAVVMVNYGGADEIQALDDAIAELKQKVTG